MSNNIIYNNMQCTIMHALYVSVLFVCVTQCQSVVQTEYWALVSFSLKQQNCLDS